MNWYEAIVLGLIQGLTEFLPVSSSGHLEIAKSIFGVDATSSFYFTVAVHAATVLSTMVVFWKEIVSLLYGCLKFKMNEETRYAIKILISMIPVAITGFLLKNPVKELFNGNIIFIGAMLLVTSSFLLTGHLIKKKERSIGYFDSLVIGIAQAIAVIPGISRSGSTIATGLILGNRKDEIAKFSFLMVLIPVIGVNLVEIVSGEAVTGSAGIGIILIGFCTAFIAGYVACKWMISLVKNSKMIWFSIYCAVVGLLSIFLG